MKKNPEVTSLAGMPQAVQVETLRNMLFDALSACERVADPVARIGAIAKARELLTELAAEAAAAAEAKVTLRAPPLGVDDELWRGVQEGDPISLAKYNGLAAEGAIPSFAALPASEERELLERLRAQIAARLEALPPPFESARPLLRVVPAVIETPANGVSNGGPTS